MKAINFVVCLCMAFMLSTFNSLAAGEDFKSFLHKLHPVLHFSIHVSSFL